MDSARQILRFSIPGSIFLLHGAVCYLVYRRFQGVSFVDASSTIQDNVAAVIAVAATIPVGFLVYQLYYFNYGPLLRPFLLPWDCKLLPWRGKLVRKDRGGTILLELDESQLKDIEDIFECEIDRDPIHQVVPEGKSLLQKLMKRSGVLVVSDAIDAQATDNKTLRRLYEDRWYVHWDALRSTMDLAAYTGEHVKSEYTSLSDIYHSLGAARTAVLTAWVGIVAIAVSHMGRIGEAPIEALGGLLAISTLTFATYVVLHVARGHTWRTAEVSLVFGLRWVLTRHAHALRPLDSSVAVSTST